MKKKLAILGSTGSIGKQTLSILNDLRDKFKVVALSTFKDVSTLKEQIMKFEPEVVCVGGEKEVKELGKLSGTKVLCGTDGLKEISQLKNIDIILISIVGSAALFPLLSAIDSGKTVALANKEALVMAGSIITKRIKDKKVKLLPVDSEHSAIFQCIQGESNKSIENIILTCSGGPFLKVKKFPKNIKVEDALKHPRWSMGKKISIDSATLANKGLEVIEAHHLFSIPFEKIKIIIHPQSIIHSMVEFCDKSVKGIMSVPDMRISIQYAITYPERYPLNIEPLDLYRIGRLEFYPPDYKKFPCLAIVLEAGKIGHTMPAVVNAANEVCVEHFLKGKIVFSDIPKILEKIMSEHRVVKNPSLEDIIFADRWARESIISQFSN